MRLQIFILTFLGVFGAATSGIAATRADMEKDCTLIAQKMMEQPATFKFVDAGPATLDNNKGVYINYTGTRESFKAKLSCFYANGEISKLHLKAELKNGETVNDYLADFLVEQARKEIRPK